MRIDRHLNLVIPVDVEKGTVYVHATPISRIVFEQYYLVLSRVFSAIYRNGLDVTVGPRVAYLMLKTQAMADGTWEGPQGVENGLMNEIRRLSNVLRPDANGGWEMVQLQDALNAGEFTDDERREIENDLVFFTVMSHIHKKNQLKDIMDGLTALWGALSTYSTCSEYMRSLPILTKDGNGGEKVA